MESQDLDLLGQTVGNMFYKIGILDKDGKLINQFVANASTNRVDIPESILGTGEVSQIPSTTNLFSGSAVGNIVLSGPSANYDNVQDGLLITFGDETLDNENYILSFGYSTPSDANHPRVDISSIGLKTIKIPKEKLVVNSSFDISDQLSQYIGKTVKIQYNHSNDLVDWDTISSDWPFSVGSFEGTTIKVLPNTTISMNLTVYVKDKAGNQAFKNYGFPIPVIQVNDYKN